MSVSDLRPKGNNRRSFDGSIPDSFRRRSGSRNGAPRQDIHAGESQNTADYKILLLADPIAFR